MQPLDLEGVTGLRGSELPGGLVLHALSQAGLTWPGSLVQPRPAWAGQLAAIKVAPGGTGSVCVGGQPGEAAADTAAPGGGEPGPRGCMA